ncbi:TolB family protein [Virgibacillus alimentarius]|uniref:TolB family protein n=1 Tax=Virgibacillus alimentarius TaxID=698769 RepID=UPI00049317D4|nr:DUF5050 domain-containing protein [Virgibacillus alimentarius]
MQRSRLIKTLIGVVALLFVISLLYGFFRDDDPYKYFTGMGKGISISPDDQTLAFSYYTDGKEAIYTANMDGSNIEKITQSEGKRLHHPAYSLDGKHLLYLSENEDGIHSLFIANHDGSEARQLSNEDSHIKDAVFSPADETIYYIAMNAKDFKKEPGETSEGFDLFSTDLGGKEKKQLTDKDRFSMNHLSVSPDGEHVYFSAFDGNKEVLRSFSVTDEKVDQTMMPRGRSRDNSVYNAQLSPGGKKFAFTTVSEESMESSLFEYELFLMDKNSGDTKRLTDLGTAVDSPVFFHKQNKLAFLEHTNWSSEPAKYRLHTVDLDSKDIETIDLQMPNSQTSKWLAKTLDQVVNGYTLGVLYIILFGLITLLIQAGGKRSVYLPAFISFGIAIAIFISSFVVAVIGNPWIGIGLGMLAAFVFVFSVMIWIFAIVIKRAVRRRE